MRNVISLICAVAMLAASGAALADVRCWTESDGFENCVYDENYNRYGPLEHQVKNVDMSKHLWGESKEWGNLFDSSEMAKIREAAGRAGKTVNQYMADKLSKD